MKEAFDALDRDRDAGAAWLIARSHTAAVEYQEEMADNMDSTGAPTAEEVEQAYKTLATAVAECEAELQALGEDPYSPLTPDRPTLP
jgi:hypothetical protein